MLFYFAGYLKCQTKHTKFVFVEGIEEGERKEKERKGEGDKSPILTAFPNLQHD